MVWWRRFISRKWPDVAAAEWSIRDAADAHAEEGKRAMRRRKSWWQNNIEDSWWGKIAVPLVGWSLIFTAFYCISWLGGIVGNLVTFVFASVLIVGSFSAITILGRSRVPLDNRRANAIGMAGGALLTLLLVAGFIFW